MGVEEWKWIIENLIRWRLHLQLLFQMWLLHWSTEHTPSCLECSCWSGNYSLPGKLWHAGQIQPAACFWRGFELKNIYNFTFFKEFKKKVRTCDIESICGPPSLNYLSSGPLQKTKFADPLWGFKENVSILLCFEDFQSQFYWDLGSELKTSIGR